jgi:ATP-dependent DNA ligase
MPLFDPARMRRFQFRYRAMITSQKQERLDSVRRWPLKVARHANASAPLPAGFIEPCLPTSAKQASSGPEWLHEIKHDGFRIITHKEGKRVQMAPSERPQC